MNLIPFSWNGYAINDWFWNGTNVGEWSSEFPVGERANLASTAVFSPIAYSFPKLSTTQVDGHHITITFHPKSVVAGHTLSYLREQLKQYFAIGVDFVPHQLIAQDYEDSNRQWYLTGIPVAVSQSSIAEFQVTLALQDPIWRVVAPSTTGNISAVASPNSQVLAIKGNVAAKPIITITPTIARTGTYLYKRYIKLYNPTGNTFPFAVSTLDITFGGFDSSALVTGGKALASGADVRVVVDGVEVNYWFGTGTHAWNQTQTQIWANIPHNVGPSGAFLNVSLPNNGTAVDIAFRGDGFNFLKAMQNAANSAILIDSEIFTFTKANVDPVNLVIRSCQRAQKTTSFAAHSSLAPIRWIEHDVWLEYGNSLAVAPIIDDTQKPMIDLGLSTNAIMQWSQFYDNTSKRPMSWQPMVVSSYINSIMKQVLTNFFTGNHGDTTANPATEMGLQMQTAVQSNVVKAESANMQWTIFHPAGFTNATISGAKYLADSTLSAWPTFAGLQTSSNGQWFNNLWNEVKPTLAATWQTFTHSAVSLAGTWAYLALRFTGSIAAKLSNIAYVQFDTVSLTLGSGVLTGAMLAEVNNYQITAVISNSATGESLTLNASVIVGQSITIDCGAKTCVRSDGTNLFNAVTLSPNRATPNWLDIGIDSNGKFTGAATIVYTEPGLAGETLNYSWSDSSL